MPVAVAVESKTTGEQAALSDFDAAYEQSSLTWSPFWNQAFEDERFYLNKQWSNDDLMWLKQQKRKARVYNRCRRLVSIISGYEMRNRLSLKIGPYGIEDDPVAEQYTGLLLHAMTFSNGYDVISECFQKGPLVTGLGWIEPFLDATTGLLRYKRRPYSHIAPDPCMSQVDMSDCGFLIARETLTKVQIKQIVPNDDGQHAFIDDLNTGGFDEKFERMPFARKRVNEDMMIYDRFWERSGKQVKKLLQLDNGIKHPWNGTKAELEEFMQLTNGRFVLIEEWERSMNLRIFVQNRLVWEGPEPLHINTYPLVPMFGYFTPESTEDDVRVQGVVRTLRDPQSNYNQRMMQMVDLVEGAINSGWIAESGSVKDERMLYQTGQAGVIWTGKGKLDAIKRIVPHGIPDSFFTLAGFDAKNMDEIPGVNEELFGTDDKDIPGIRSNMRTGAALTSLQPLYNNMRSSKRHVGLLSTKIFQMNYDSQTIQRILNKPVDENFYLRDLLTYDCVPTEGIFTDTQKQMFYEELKIMQKEGAPIPWSAIIKWSPVQFSKELQQILQQGEQAQSQAQQHRQRQEQLLMMMQQAQIAADLGRAEERRTQALENKTGAALDRAKTVAQIQELGTKVVSNTIQAAQALEQGSTSDRGQSPTAPKIERVQARRRVPQVNRR